MIRLRVIDSREMQIGDSCLVLRHMVNAETRSCVDVPVVIEYKDKHFEPWTEAKVITQKLSVVPNDQQKSQESDAQGSPQGEAERVRSGTPEESGTS